MSEAGLEPVHSPPMNKHGVEFDVNFSFRGSLWLSASGFGFGTINLWFCTTSSNPDYYLVRWFAFDSSSLGCSLLGFGPGWF